MPIKAHLKWVHKEDGAITLLSLFLLLICLILGGLAVDINKVISERTQLQVAADSAAHAALYSREKHSPDESIARATETVASMLPPNQFGYNALLATDVSFGKWDFAEQSFVQDPNSRSAVQVHAMMEEARDNASRNFLLRLVGRDTFDVRVESVYSTGHL